MDVNNESDKVMSREEKEDEIIIIIEKCDDSFMKIYINWVLVIILWVFVVVER